MRSPRRRWSTRSLGERFSIRPSGVAGFCRFAGFRTRTPRNAENLENPLPRPDRAPAWRRRRRLLRHLAAVLIEEAVAGLVEALRELPAGLARHGHEAREGRLRLPDLLRHAAPLGLVARPATDRIGRQGLAEARGEILPRLRPPVVLRDETLEAGHQLLHALPARVDVQLAVLERVRERRQHVLHGAHEAAAERIGALAHRGGGLVPPRPQRADFLEQIRRRLDGLRPFRRQERLELHGERLAIRLPRFDLDLVAAPVAIA